MEKKKLGEKRDRGGGERVGGDETPAQPGKKKKKHLGKKEFPVSPLPGKEIRRVARRKESPGKQLWDSNTTRHTTRKK